MVAIGHDWQGRAAGVINIVRLTDSHRRVVVLHHIHGVPLEQLAADEGVALGTIKSRLHRGRAHLAELLGDPS